jgi:GDPmannose 4,6-dehydratase
MRGVAFVTRKITSAVAQIELNPCSRLFLGNISACRDWGFARDYVPAMWAMLQQEVPQDFIIATGESRSVAQFATVAFELAGLNWHDHTTPWCEELLRERDVAELFGNPSRAKRELNWQPRVTFQQLVSIMLEADRGRAKHPFRERTYSV